MLVGKKENSIFYFTKQREGGKREKQALNLSIVPRGSWLIEVTFFPPGEIWSSSMWDLQEAGKS